MSVFLESTHLFPCYICQTRILAEFLLRHLHSGMGERNLEYKKNVVDTGGLILKSLYLLVYSPQRTTSKFMNLLLLYIVLLGRIFRNIHSYDLPLQRVGRSHDTNLIL